MPNSSSEFTIIVQGMDCANCARSVEAGVAQLPGVHSCELNFTTERLQVRGIISRAQVIQRVRDLGYEVAEGPTSRSEPGVASAPPNILMFMWARPATRLALIGAMLMLPGAILHELLGWEAQWIDALAIAALALTIVPVARGAWRGLIVSRGFNIHALMTIATVGAMFIGATIEAAMILVLFTIGEALEGYTATRARHAIKSLIEVVPPMAIRLDPAAGEQQVAVSALRIGDRILVRPGERIPIDGILYTGYSAVNQAPITGESRLVEKEPGAELFAGSINGEGSLEVTVTRLAEDTTIARMIRLVEEAQERRAPVQRFIDRFARSYTPAVILLALLVALVPPLFFNQPFWHGATESAGWLYRGLALLVVACPCALVISTPVTLVSAMSAAARSGVLIKGGIFLEQLSKLRAIAFDKTGTLTSGRPAVVALRAAACPAPTATALGHCTACDELLALAGAVERRSEHPLAHAITMASTARGLDAQLPRAEAVTALVGRGVSGQVGGRDVLVGSHRHFDSVISHDAAHCEAAHADAAGGYTPVMVSVGGEYCGTITLADTLRPTSREAVAQLRAQGLQALVMLTGDQRSTAERLASEVGVTELQAELLPAQKVAAVESLQRTYGSVAMVGDGINDTPALAAANVGIAIGGTSQAMETADVTLMSDDLRRIPFVIGLSRAAMECVRVNIALSILIKLIFLVLALLGQSSVWMAVLADTGTSLLVTLNGMRLLGYRSEEQAKLRRG